MKRQISVSIFLAIILLVLIWLYIKINNETKPKENAIMTEDNAYKDSVSMIEGNNENYKYFITEEYEKLVVYTCQDQKIYMETSIHKSCLPEDLQKRLKKKIYFHTDRELYDFLESYSS